MSVPQLRFDGFDGEWKQQELSELLEFKNGINADKDSYGYGTKFINVLDILNNDYILSEKIIGSVNATEQQLQTYSVTYGDILFLRSSETREDVGKCNVYLDEEKPAVFGGFVIRGKKMVNYSPFFLKASLNNSSARDQISSKAGGSTRYNVGQSILSEVTVKVPDIEEQEKISSFLMLLNQRIKKQKEKIEKQEQFKKGIMQKIFSQELRFKNEDGMEFGEWRSKKLIEEANIYQPKTISQKDLVSDGYSVYGANGIIGYYTQYNHASEQIAITCRGNTCGTLNFTKQFSWITGNAMVINVDENQSVNKKYLYFFLENISFRSIITGSGQPQITRDSMKNLGIKLPVIQEQQKIACFLEHLILKVKKEKEKLIVLEKQKKGFMQRMFI